MKSTKLNHLIAIGLLLTLGFMPRPGEAQTVISGPNILTSTWSPAGSPYIVTANCTVPSGQTLTILPGTTVWMGNGTSLTGNGVISAVGTAAQPIRFEPPVLSQMWNTVVINNTVGTNQFKHCNFLNATNALDFRGLSKNEVTSCAFSNVAVAAVSFRGQSVNRIQSSSFQAVQYGIYMIANDALISTRQTNAVLGCTFSGCTSKSVFGEALGFASIYTRTDAYISARIQNCDFAYSAMGCEFRLWGQYNINTGTGYGYSDVSLDNNIILGVTNEGVSLITAGYTLPSSARVFNNVFVGCGKGLVAQDPWDAKVQNNLIKGSAIGISRSGSLSATVSYNDLFGNTANFSGYPVTYGQVILANRNGTPCDVLFNIFSDPMFVSPSDFHLQAGSPCIDAGEGSGANFDSYFPPSMGSVTNDIGAYGGPNAGQWIVLPPTNAFTLAISKYTMASVTVNPPEPGNYRLEYSSALLGTNTWIQITNLPLTTLPFTYTEPVAVPARYYRAVKQ